VQQRGSLEVQIWMRILTEHRRAGARQCRLQGTGLLAHHPLQRRGDLDLVRPPCDVLVDGRQLNGLHRPPLGGGLPAQRFCLLSTGAQSHPHDRMIPA
jgi:hypothetical protein